MKINKDVTKLEGYYDFFGNDTDVVLHYGKYYLSRYNEIYSTYLFQCEINLKNVFNELKIKYNLQNSDIIIENTEVRQKSNANSFEEEFSYNDELFIQLKEKFFVALINKGVMMLFNKEEIDKTEVESIIEIAKKNKNENKNVKNKYAMIMKEDYGGYNLGLFDIKKINVSFEDNYNNDFIKINNTIMSKLAEDSATGMILLHGSPGTGKTSYIRYLISNIEANFILLPNYLLSSLSSPDFLPFIIKHKNAILIIEDCDSVIVSRETSGNHSNAIANLLNLSDGLLADALSIKIICTFNTNIKNIDKALLRKGRLIAKYEFKELEVDKCNKLAEKINCDLHYEKPTKLSEIYNWNKDNDAEIGENKKIGFN